MEPIMNHTVTKFTLWQCHVADIALRLRGRTRVSKITAQTGHLAQTGETISMIRRPQAMETVRENGQKMCTKDDRPPSRPSGATIAAEVNTVQASSHRSLTGLTDREAIAGQIFTGRSPDGKVL